MDESRIPFEEAPSPGITCAATLSHFP